MFDGLIAVHQPPLVQEGKPRRDLQRHRQTLFEGPTAVVDGIQQGLVTLDILERQVWRGALQTNVEHPHDRRMHEIAHGEALAPEALEQRKRDPVLDVEHLERNEPIEGDLASEIDDPHAPPTQFPDDLVSGNGVHLPFSLSLIPLQRLQVHGLHPKMRKCPPARTA
jgi:hypothetical protein